MEYIMDVNGLKVNAVFDDTCVQNIFIPLLKHLTNLQKEKNKRILVMLAAPPGAGKSTLASFLEHLSKQDDTLTDIQVIGMDGFHHYQDYLLTHTTYRDEKEIKMVDIKGAPITFDLPLFIESIQKVTQEKESDWPLYDRVLHNPREHALKVSGDIVLLEGNYLLLEDEGWNTVSSYSDYTIKIIAKEEDLKTRLVMRKAHSVPVHEAILFVEKSDLINARYVLEHSKEANLTLEMLGDGIFKTSDTEK